MPQRETEIAKLAFRRGRDDLGANTLTLVDVYQTLYRAPKGFNNTLSMCLPSSKIFVAEDETRPQWRLVTGTESLSRLQGFPSRLILFESDATPKEKVALNPLCQHFGGNSFPFAVISAVYGGTFVHLPMKPKFDSEDEKVAMELLRGLS